MFKWSADLHIHTCLSPCAELEMYPSNIIKTALAQSLDMIAISDHNSVDNAQYCIKSAISTNITVLPAIEITTAEEIHILAIFESVENANQMCEIVQANLFGKNNPDTFGMQVIVNELNQVEGYCEKLLINASALSIEDTINYIHMLNGLAIAAHIDREAFSIINQLGFIPEGLELDGLEVSSNSDIYKIKQKYHQFSDLPIISNSDAHRISEIGKTRTTFIAESPSFEEFKMALSNEQGRRLE
jgi:3',5'-nucleoside bisphosphate phosphatase